MGEGGDLHIEHMGVNSGYIDYAHRLEQLLILESEVIRISAWGRVVTCTLSTWGSTQVI